MYVIYVKILIISQGWNNNKIYINDRKILILYNVIIKNYLKFNNTFYIKYVKNK